MHEGEGFLKEKYNLHKSEEVESAAHRTEVRSGKKFTQNPADRIQNYLDRFSEILDRKDPAKRERGIEALKKVLYDNFVIAPEEIPEGYYENQRRLAREQGYGDIEITPEMRRQLAEVVVTDQKSSLDTWIDYLSSQDATYPDWLKYWAIRSVLQMGEFDKEKHQFTKRSAGTTKPFPDLNREALAYVLDAVEKDVHEIADYRPQLDREENEKFEKLLESKNFAKLYAWAIEKVTPAEKDLLRETRGKWVKYDRNSDHMPLVQSLQGHGTGWCTAGESTAKAQLEGGDFYVYYSLDQKGEPSIPRAAVRMHENYIAEVRGIAADQNLDPFIGKVVQEKLKEFPDGELYEKKAADMKRLTEIDTKKKNGEELSIEDLRFLYEIDAHIQGFGYAKDPRIAELLEGRDIRNDIARAAGCSPEEVSLTDQEGRKADIKLHYGDLYQDAFKTGKDLRLADRVSGGLYLRNLTSAQDLKLPEYVGGDLNIHSLAFAPGLKLPNHVGGSLDLRSLKSAIGVKLPEHVGGNLILTDLSSAEGLKLPNHVGGYLNLQRLTSAEGLKLPEHVGGNLHLNGLTSAQDLKLPEYVGGSLYLWAISSAKGLKLPEYVGGNLILTDLSSAEGLKLPNHVGGSLDLRSLKSAIGVKLPEHVGGCLHLGKISWDERNRLEQTRPDIRIL